MGFQLKFICVLILMSIISTKCDDSNEEPVEMMTTVEPIDSADDHLYNSEDFSASSGTVNCSLYSSSCDTCLKNNCSWVMCSDVIDDHTQCTDAVGVNCTVSACEHDDCKNVTDCEQCGKAGCDWVQCSESEEGPYCGKAAELCPPIACNATDVTTTAAPNDTTTTVQPPETTTTLPDTTTTPSPDTTTTSPDTTTSSPDTTTSSPDTTTSSPSPDTTTSPPPPDTTTEAPTTTVPNTTPGPAPAPAPQSGGFSAGSFFGGITLTLALIGVGLGGYKFYKTRYDVNYRTL